MNESDSSKSYMCGTQKLVIPCLQQVQHNICDGCLSSGADGYL